MPLEVLPERLRDGVTLFKRVNGGEWEPLDTGVTDCTFRFPASGEYLCEVTGLKLGGTIKKGVSVRVDAQVKLPDTVLTPAITSPVSVESLEWYMPVAARPTGEGVKTEIDWRVDDGHWQPLPEDRLLPLFRLEPGRYTVEVAAVEDGFWRDPSPIRLAIDYKPDYEAFAAHWVDELLSEDAMRRETAREKLSQLGKNGVQVLRRKLEEARKAARLVRELERVIRDMGAQDRPQYPWEKSAAEVLPKEGYLPPSASQHGSR